MCNSELIDDYAFYFIDDIKEPFIQLISIGHQIRRKKTYYYDNRQREECYLFQYTLSGSGTLELEGKKYLLEKEKGFFISMPGDSIYYFDEKENQDWEFIYILFRGKELKRYYEYIRAREGNILTISEYHPVIRKMQALFEEVKRGQISDSFVLSSRTFELLCMLCSLNLEKNGNTVEKAKEYMQRHFQNGCGLSQVADHLHVTQSHLSRIFLGETGQKPVEYLTRLRIESAVNYLVMTEKSIDEIAGLCGFSCGNYFDKVFKKHFHISPGRFRSIVKNEGYSRVQI